MLNDELIMMSIHACAFSINIAANVV